MQANGAVGHNRANIAAADNAQHFAGQLHTHEAVFLPLARLCRNISGRNLARQRKHHGNGVFGGGDGIAERRIHHDDALSGGGGNVNVINANTGAANHLQVGGIGENFVRDFGGRANG